MESRRRPIPEINIKEMRYDRRSKRRLVHSCCRAIKEGPGRLIAQSYSKQFEESQLSERDCCDLVHIVDGDYVQNCYKLNNKWLRSY